MIARRLVVSGRVQGVWYRDSCRQRASASHVAGWVRNLDDGRVEIWLEGEEPAVDDVTRWCRTGPSRAVVTAVEVEERQPAGFPSFRIVD